MADVFTLIKDWLSDIDNGSWLMIIDNADDRDVFYDDGDGTPTLSSGKEGQPLLFYIPQSAHGNIIFTSRNHTGAEIAGGDDYAFAVEALEECAALNILQHKLAQASDDTYSRDLVRTLDYIPLAINQAAAYIRKTGITVFKYLSIFKRNEDTELELLGKEYYDIYQDSSSARAITTSWKLSFGKIRAVSFVAADALGMMCMTDRSTITEDIIFEEDISELHRLEAIGLLLEYSLVQREQETEMKYSMHRLVQVCTRAYLKAETTLHAYETRAVQILNVQFPHVVYDPMSWPRADSLAPHARKVLDYKIDTSAVKTSLNLMYRTGVYEEMRGNYSTSKALISQALVSSESCDPPLEVSTSIELRLMLLRCLMNLQQYDEFVDMHKQALDFTVRARDQAQTEGQEHGNCDRETDVLQFMVIGMEVVQDARNLNEAKYLCNQMVTLVEKDYGPNDLSFFHALNAHGVVCFRLGLLAEAEESFRRVCHGREAILCLDHGDTLEAAYDLATVLGLRGRYDLAEQLFKHALTGQEKLYGRTNMKVLDTVLGLAWLYNKQGRVQEAESLYERCLEGAERWLGPTQFDTLRVVRILARFYFEQERYSEAAALYERALAGERQQRRVNNVRSLKLTHNIGVVYNRQQRHEEAETKFLEALNGSDGILARSYPDTLEYVDEEPSLRTDRIDLDDWERTYIDQWTRHRFSSGEDVEERVVEADGA